MANNYKIVSMPTFKTPGIVSNILTGEDFTIWKCRYNSGVFFEDCNENRFSTMSEIVNGKLSHDQGPFNEDD